MDYESRSKNDVPTPESVRANLARLKRKIHDYVVLMLRITIGDIKGLNGFQTYMKFKLVVMNLDKFFRPEESSWPVVLFKVFMPHSNDLAAKIRFMKSNILSWRLKAI